MALNGHKHSSDTMAGIYDLAFVGAPSVVCIAGKSQVMCHLRQKMGQIKLLL